ncbi:MAG: aminoacyl-tRNA hydrolase [Candidatus Omnitrophica bacterium]|nr:aminoacyl-tRNA hydrolase [Candidatus Omnitrophota bacterium]MDD5238428.1 aminoacyl-tRNA hydrolase [Candidatus Omnitrophota bacterium]
MKLIVGLGNPGDIYAGSRHNIGFSLIKALAKSHKILLKNDRAAFSLSGKGQIESQNIILAMPLTFMNLSGEAVKSLLKRHRILADDLLVVCDDLDLEFGRLKIRPGGSSGGHRGLESVIGSLNNTKFARLRIGIGRPLQSRNSAEYVLGNFTREEKKEIKQIIGRASECCLVWLKRGVTEAMNIFNGIGKYKILSSTTRKSQKVIVESDFLVKKFERGSE